ncbi:DUF2628 domain-containing protein [Bacillus salinus]|uniref:DUF2628 domain-containing protein n=1 Tax=Bacillus sp. HMF5848 TaxID=2495421 RepID=UPI00163A88D8|nr:DUF2628 domain-containing protein [Bacillus sp. HMF5848]
MDYSEHIPNDEEQVQELLPFVGKRQEFYSKKWAQFKNQKNNLSWNWAAFLLGFVWLVYRKMYLYGYLALAIIITVDIIYILILKEAMSSSVFAGTFIIFGLSGNQFYLDFVKKQVNKIKQADLGESERIKKMKKQGGVSWKGVLLYLVVFIIYSFSITLLEEKVYVSYMEPLFLQAVQLQQEDKHAEAISIYKEIENKDYPIPALYYNLALSYFQIGDRENATKTIQTLLKLTPEDKDALELKNQIILDEE